MINQLTLLLQPHSQRAFRERKERHVKDLETKLNSLEAHSSTLLTDNERLKRELARLATQNEILRATTTTSSTSNSTSPLPRPQSYSPTDFAAHARSSNPSNRRIVRNASTGERLLATGATWDLIQGHELFRQGLVDVGDVCERLKARAVCDGSGPAFAEGEVRRAVEESVAGGSDELI